ncbi:MAG TPA: FAD-binding protein, partial [Thermoleophilia bacterium]|nr:FAD-binding protein [Thermoleophilia bacterium]
IFSGHMVGEFLATGRPLCVSVEPGLRPRDRRDDGELVSRAKAMADERTANAGAARREARPSDHVVVSDTPLGADASTTDPLPFDDVELTAPPSRGDLIEARFLVVAGNGLGGREPVDRLAAAAHRMGATFGVTRPVAMNGWAPLDRLLGVSGARTAPDVCVVAGASGAPAFTWGIEQAGLIVAVNPDEHAPIARAADYVVLDDGLAVVEALAEVIAQRPRA